MARRIAYRSLGTFEFLAREETDEFFFLEINPRVQVEHTVTEEVAGVDLVRAQLLVAQGASLAEAGADGPASANSDDALTPPPRGCAVQLRLTAESVHAGWSVSVGRIASFGFPGGNGVRIDTALVHGAPAVVGADFDALLAKIVVRGATWGEVVAKAARALRETRVEGVNTNLDALRGIVASEDFREVRCDTTWLEAKMDEVLRVGREISREAKKKAGQQDGSSASSSAANLTGSSSSAVVLRKGDAWKLTLTPTDAGSSSSSNGDAPPHHIKLLRVLRNEFPSSLAADIAYTAPSTSSPTTFRLDLAATTASSGSIMAASKHRRGDAGNPAHVVIPFPGRLVEVLVDVGDTIREGDVVCVVQQMKMELEVRAPRAGRVVWITEAEDGEDVAEGSLAAEVELEGETRPKL